MCVRIFQLFQFQIAYIIKQMVCVYDCVRACVCVCACAWQMVAHLCLIALAAKGLTISLPFKVKACYSKFYFHVLDYWVCLQSCYFLHLKNSNIDIFNKTHNLPT